MKISPTPPPNREVALFSAALELPAGERAAYLDEACPDDPALRLRLETLLQVHEEAIPFLENPPPGAQEAPMGAGVPNATVRLSFSPAEKAGDRIGRYKLLQQIGEGGCGVVYMAEQTEPVRRRVALKVIKLGMDTKQVIARFEAERQALALMDHPNIAKVLDAGATETGRPYFVMELVRGIKITEYCDDNNLSTRERLDLFIQVCQAIQHAHQKGIIHRDIKPSNILVTVSEPGAPGCPKVIDFGIAKATTDQRLTDKTLFTAFEQFMGTPAYMSPEQALMTALDIDTRTDIYSLGVLLYELLTGKTPLDQKELLAAGLDDMRRTIREQEPARPSTRLSTMLAAELTTTAKHRHTDAPKLIHLLRGDLDWIVMKSLEKDRARRYETANGLADDIQRHLNCEPVVARPPSRFYEFQKTVRRHKFGFAAAAALITVLAVGALVSTLEAIRATRAEGEQIRMRLQAEQAGDTAKRQEHLARESADNARLQQGLASEQALLARRRFYAAQMNLANQAVEAGQPGRALELLESQRPKAAAEDLRTFEWYHLWGRCNARLRMTLRAHHEPVNSVAISPDGKTLASASGDSTIRLWDTSTGREGLTLKLPPVNPAFAVAFTPDGKTVAAGYWDGLVRLWDVASGKLRAALPCADGWVRGLAISPDGNCLACGGDKGLIKLLDLATGVEKATLLHEGHVLGIAFSPDGRNLASTSFASVKIWDLNHGPIQPMLQDTPPSRAVAFSPDGKLLATAAADVLVWDTTTGLLRATLMGHTPAIESLVWLPDGKALASCASDRTVRLWSMPPTNSVVTDNEIIGEHLDMAMCLAVSADGTTLASGGNDGSVKVWNLGTSREQAEAQVASHFQIGSGSTNGGLTSLLFSPDGNSLIGVMEHATAARNIAAGLDYLVLAGATGRGALSPDGKLLATGDRAGTVKLWDFPSGRLLATTQAHTSEVCLAFSPDGRMLATCGLLEPELKAWDPIKALRPLWGTASKPATLGISALAFSPDGKTIAAMVRHTGVAFVDAATGRQNERFPVERGFTEVWALAFSPDGRFVATGSESGAARLWNVETGELHAALQGHTAMIYAVAFSPDGGTIATGSDDQTVRLWDAVTGQERITLKGFQSWLRAVTFSPDGNTLAAGSIDGRVCLWRANRTAEATAYGERDPLLAELANARLREGKFAEAETLYREDLAARRKLLGNEHADVATSLNSLGYALREQRKWAEAESVTREALAMRRKLFGNEQQAVAESLSDLSFLLREQGKLPEAEATAREGLAIRKKLLGNEHADVAQSLHLLAWNLNLEGKHAEAEALSREEVAMWRKLLGNDDPNVAWALGDLTVFLRDQEKLTEAEATIRESLAIRRKRLGNTHHDTINSFSLLFSLLRAQGKLAEARSMYPEVAERGNAAELNEFAWLLATGPDPNLRDGSNAVIFAEKAVAVTSRKEPNCLDTLAAAYAEVGQFTNAVRVQQEAIALLQNEQETEDYASRLKLYENKSPYRDSGLLAEQAYARLGEGKFAEAEGLARECLGFREREIPDDWRAFNARSMLGGALLGQKKYAEAAPWLRSGYEGMRQRELGIPPDAKVRLKEALQRLVQLYKETNRPDQAAEWKKKLADTAALVEGQTNLPPEK